MPEAIWAPFLTAADQQVLDATGYAVRAGPGERPALLVIDANWAFCGDQREPLADAVKKWRNACGHAAWDAVDRIRELVDRCHERGIPVIYTTANLRQDYWDAGSWAWKTHRAAEDPVSPVPGLDPNGIVTPIAPQPQDIVVYKQKPSGFFGSNLASYLTLLHCDSVVVTGGTTSGCVRATVLDAFSYNYRVTVAADACFDRFESSHALSLFDMNAKYADVVATAEVLELLSGVPAEAFELPAGA